MGKEKLDVIYDEKGRAVRVQMDFDLYEWLMEQVPSMDEKLIVAG